MIRVGTAGWSLPAKPEGEGTHLRHYARTLGCAEINSSFYRPHRASTWAKWAAETPKDFRFSIKAPKAITHEAKLRDAGSLLKEFLEQIAPMGKKTGPILFQLPPSLAFDASLAEDFLGTVRDQYRGEVALEPRNASWFTDEVKATLAKNHVARVAADPPKGDPRAAEPGGATRLVYYRLHGSPRIYYSAYEDEFLDALAGKLRGHRNAWVIFDNTVLSHAYRNAMSLQSLVKT